MVEIWLFFPSNLCHLLKVNALLHVLPQLLHHSDINVSLQKSRTNFLKSENILGHWCQCSVTYLEQGIENFFINDWGSAEVVKCRCDLAAKIGQNHIEGSLKLGQKFFNAN